MAILVTSGERLGLRALGSGGRTALSSYEQITRTLGASLGGAHAALFCEPSIRGSVIDWFAQGEHTGRPVRLREAEPSARETGRERLEGLTDDISEKAATLKKSDRDSDRILGDMLEFALEIPSEDAVWLVDGQPVLTFWGHVVDKGRPAENPLRTLIRSRPPPTAATRQQPYVGEGQDLVSSKTMTARVQTERTVTPTIGMSPVQAAMIWVVFAGLCLTCGFTLLRGCGIKGFRSGFLLNYCPSNADASVPGLDDELSLQAALKAEYDDLARQADLKRQACFLTAPKAAPKPKPVIDPKPAPKPDPNQQRTENPKPPSKDSMVIPQKPDHFDFLKGCWRSDHGITDIVNGKDSGRFIVETFCFGENGHGSRTIKFEDNGHICRGSLQAEFKGDDLAILLDEAPCTAGDGSFKAARDICRPAANGEARCDETADGDTEPGVKDFRFYKD